MHTHRTPLFCDTALAARIERVEAQLVTLAARAASRRNDGRGLRDPRRRRRRELRRGGLAVQQGRRARLRAASRTGPRSTRSSVPSPPAPPRSRSSFRTWPTPRSAPSSPTVVTGSSRSRTCSAAHSRASRTTSRRPASRSGAVVTTSSTPGSTSRRTPSPTPTRRACPGTRSSPARSTCAPSATWRGRVSCGTPLCTSACSPAVAGLRIAEGVAQFAGAATAPAHRRHGIQAALLSARLVDAAAAGCDVAVIVTQPGSKSQQNAQRRGLRPALHPRRAGEAALTPWLDIGARRATTSCGGLTPAPWCRG